MLQKFDNLFICSILAERSLECFTLIILLLINSSSHITPVTPKYSKLSLQYHVINTLTAISNQAVVFTPVFLPVCSSSAAPLREDSCPEGKNISLKTSLSRS